MEKEHILFIVNPISGGKRRRFKVELVEKYVDPNRFSYEIYETIQAGDGHAKVKDSLNEFDGFVAVGGDGTVNEVFTAIVHTDKWFTDIEYQEGDVLLFGTEPTGLPEEHINHPRVTDHVRIPMVPARRSMNLSNSASTAVFEAWRQLGFNGAV